MTRKFTQDNKIKIASDYIVHTLETRFPKVQRTNFSLLCNYKGLAKTWQWVRILVSD